MKKLVVAILVTVFSMILLLILGFAKFPAEAAPVEKVFVCHAAGRAGTTHYVTLEVPPNDGGYPQGHFAENGTPLAGHEDDYLGACATSTPTSIPTSTPSNTPTNTEVPSATPTATPTDTDVAPTDTPTSTQEPSATPTPTEESDPTATPTSVGDTPTPTTTVGRPTPTDDCIPGGGTEFAPCATVTPTRGKTCDSKLIGVLFELLGPNGEVGRLASYQINPNTGRFAIPNVNAQSQCLGFVAVNVGKTWEIKMDCQGKVNILTYRCTGGGCPKVYKD